jgi:hypothetical protein
MTTQEREVTSDLLDLAYLLVNAEVRSVSSFLNAPYFSLSAILN